MVREAVVVGRLDACGSRGIVALQRMVGNAAAARVIQRARAVAVDGSPQVGASKQPQSRSPVLDVVGQGAGRPDPFEQAAEATAHQVMSNTTPTPTAAASAASTTSTVQRTLDPTVRPVPGPNASGGTSAGATMLSSSEQDTFGGPVVGGGSGPAVVVPNTVHMVWMGGSLSDAARRNIRAWADKARQSGWHLKLWMDKVARQNKTNSDFINELTRDYGSTVRADMIDRTGFPRGSKAQKLYDHAVKDEAYAMASDLWRYRTLDAEGGVYADVDVAPGAVTLPGNGFSMRTGPNSVPFLGPLIRDNSQLEAYRTGQGGHGAPLSRQDALSGLATHQYQRGQFGNQFMIAPQGMPFLKQAMDALPAVPPEDVLDAYRTLHGKDKNPSKADKDAAMRLLSGYANKQSLLDGLTNPKKEAASVTGPDFIKKQIDGTGNKEEGVGVDQELVDHWKGADWVTVESANQEHRQSQPQACAAGTSGGSGTSRGRDKERNSVCTRIVAAAENGDGVQLLTGVGAWARYFPNTPLPDETADLAIRAWPQMLADENAQTALRNANVDNLRRILGLEPQTVERPRTLEEVRQEVRTNPSNGTTRADPVRPAAGNSASGQDAVPASCLPSRRTPDANRNASQGQSDDHELKKRGTDHADQSCPPGYERVNVTDTKFRQSTVGIGHGSADPNGGWMQVTADSAALTYNQYSNTLAFDADIHTEYLDRAGLVMHDDTYPKEFYFRVAIWKEGDEVSAPYVKEFQRKTSDSHFRPRFEGITFRGWGEYGYSIKCSYDGGAWDQPNRAYRPLPLEVSTNFGGAAIDLKDDPKDAPPPIGPQPGRPSSKIILHGNFYAHVGDRSASTSWTTIWDATLGYIPASDTLAFGIRAMSSYREAHPLGAYLDKDEMYVNKDYSVEVKVSYGGEEYHTLEPKTFHQYGYQFNPRFEGIPFKGWGEYQVTFRIIKKKGQLVRLGPDTSDVDTGYVTEKFTLRKSS